MIDKKYTFSSFYLSTMPLDSIKKHVSDGITSADARSFVHQHIIITHLSFPPAV